MAAAWCSPRGGSLRAGLLSVTAALAGLALLQLTDWRQLCRPQTLAARQISGTVTGEGEPARVLPASEAGEGEPARVLLMTYMRAGSTFTAELLTLRPDFNYLFEPLWRFRSERVPGFSAAEMRESRARYIAGLFACDPLMTAEALKDEFVNRVRFELADCRKRPLLAKVIRAEGDTFSHLLQMLPNLKIIHLVRDPRATVSSRSHVGAKDSGALYCQEIREHLHIADQLTVNDTSRYTVVRYEDLADRSTLYRELERLYGFMGFPLPEQALDEYLEGHYQSISRKETGSLEKRKPPDDYGTRKQADYNPSTWKDRLSSDRVRQIEADCRDVMERFSYELLRPVSQVAPP